VLRWALFAGLAACAGPGSETSGRSPGFFDPWIGGGQTGSLRPVCGLPSAALSGVPAGEGFVVYTSECDGIYFSPSDLTLRDANGRAIAFDVQALGGGAVLITPESTLPPGAYSLASRPLDDEDAGVEGDDAGSAPSVPGPGVDQVLHVEPVAPEPARFGMITRVGESCSPTFELELEPETAARASRLALELQVDGGAAMPFIAFGTLELREELALVTLPEELWTRLVQGTHTLTWIVRLAGQDAPLESIEMPLEVACYPTDSYGGSSTEEDSSCSLTHAPRTGGSALESLCLALAATLLARRRRKRS
jgi:hypothetical protein